MNAQLVSLLNICYLFCVIFDVQFFNIKNNTSQLVEELTSLGEYYKLEKNN